MARFELLLVLCALGVLHVSAAEGVKSAEVDSQVSESQEGLSEINSYEEALDEPNERRRREAPKTGNSISQFIRSEKTNTTGDNIIWRDNSETRKQGRIPTVTRVLHHGIYPSLNITVPLNGSHHVHRYRQKRSPALGSPQGTSEKDFKLSTSSSTGTVSTRELGDRWQTEGRGIRKTKSTIDNMLDETQGYTQLRETPTSYPTSAYPSRRDSIGGNHYQRADHSEDRLNNPYLNLDSSVPKDYAQGSIRYRTMYMPASNSEYQGDPENKGRVKLISVGYYSINESTADLRSYRNPKVDRNVQTSIQPRKPRTKRDAHWCWLDKFFKSIWVMKNPETKELENEIQGSEPLKLEMRDVNEEAQDVYGYSSNGHSHPHNVDRIYLVQNEKIQNPILPRNPNPNEQMMKSSTAAATLPPGVSMEQTTPSDMEPEEIPLPAGGPILIQAPPRKIACRPPKRLARGRCRTVW